MKRIKKEKNNTVRPASLKIGGASAASKPRIRPVFEGAVALCTIQSAVMAISGILLIASWQ
jgi:hypothetical protein